MVLLRVFHHGVHGAHVPLPQLQMGALCGCRRWFGEGQATVQGFPGVSRKAVTLLRRDSVDVYLVSFRPFYLFFFQTFFYYQRRGEKWRDPPL